MAYASVKRPSGRGTMRGSCGRSLLRVGLTGANHEVHEVEQSPKHIVDVIGVIDRCPSDLAMANGEVVSDRSQARGVSCDLR
jgi:hypothetical protein